MKLGGSARVRVSNAQGCFLSHTISSRSGDGKHGGMKLLVFDFRRGSRTIMPQRHTMLQRDRKRIEQKCEHRNIRQRLAVGVQKDLSAKGCPLLSLRPSSREPASARARLSARLRSSGPRWPILHVSALGPWPHRRRYMWPGPADRARPAG